MKLYLLVVMRTIGYGQATAPSGWAERRGCPAKRWDETEGEEGAYWLLAVGYWREQVGHSC